MPLIQIMKKGIDYIGVSVGAMIFNDAGELFLAKRSQNCKNERGHWEVPGGGVEFGETLTSAVKREIKEEFGIDIEILSQFPAADHLIPKENQHWVPTTFLAKIKKGQIPQILEPDKCDAIGFFPLNQLPNPLSIITQLDLEYYKKKIHSKSHYDFFVSGRWRNRDNVLALTKQIREKGYRVYCFLEASHSIHRVQNDPEKDMQAFEKLDWRHDPYVKEVFQNDMEGERTSETFVLLLPAGKSCHIEAGVAYGLGKKCILIGEQKEAESLYLIFSEMYPTVDEFLNCI